MFDPTQVASLPAEQTRRCRGGVVALGSSPEDRDEVRGEGGAGQERGAKTPRKLHSPNQILKATDLVRFFSLLQSLRYARGWQGELRD